MLVGYILVSQLKGPFRFQIDQYYQSTFNTQLTRNFLFSSQIMIIKQSIQCECKESILTFLSKSASSVLAFSVLDFFSYPGGGNGKQRDIAQNPNMCSISSS